MSFHDTRWYALNIAALLLLQTFAASFAQGVTLTGSVNQDRYRPRVITQDPSMAPEGMSPSNPLYGNIESAHKVPASSFKTEKKYSAQARRVEYVDRPVYRTVYVRDNRTFFQRHPKVKAATVGAGVGAGVGAITGLVTHRGVMRGALIGGGTGAGVGLVRSSDTFKRHPIVRNLATGSLVGLGIGGAASRGHRRALQGAGIGAAVGLGASLLNGEFR